MLGTLDDCVSVNDLTIRAAIVIGLAIFALLLVGWRKSARATPVSPRGRDGQPQNAPVIVERLPTELYRPPSPLRRLWALVASGGLTVLLAAVIATVLAFGTSMLVTRMTDLLKQ